MGDGSLLPFSEEDVYKVLHIPLKENVVSPPSFVQEWMRQYTFADA
jgi:hypothetical protein